MYKGPFFEVPVRIKEENKFDHVLKTLGGIGEKVKIKKKIFSP
jgi:hypothetical protein